MRAGRASRTAEQNALFRALETDLPAGRRLFADPLAHAFLGRGFTAAAALARLPGIGPWLPAYIDARWPGVRSSVVARTRLIDDWLGELLAEPVVQVVLLGAGFDSRPYRLPRLRSLRSYEVDHPATQHRKRDRVARTDTSLPVGHRFVPVDFAKGELAAQMRAAGYRERDRTLFLWEGVTNYLDEPSVDATLRWCARAAAGSLLLFTYVDRAILTHPERFAGNRALQAALSRIGERFTFGLAPEEVAGFLAARGLRLERDVACPEFRARYYGEAAERMRGHEFYHVALARVF
jgi:methyltransferase (TIGR00027 family)